MSKLPDGFLRAACSKAASSFECSTSKKLRAEISVSLYAGISTADTSYSFLTFVIVRVCSYAVILGFAHRKGKGHFIDIPAVDFLIQFAPRLCAAEVGFHVQAAFVDGQRKRLLRRRATTLPP